MDKCYCCGDELVTTSEILYGACWSCLDYDMKCHDEEKGGDL